MMSQVQLNGEPRSPKILIIGAGIAGISCGEYLVRNGFKDFQILEASNRTGGRIWSVDVDKQHKTEMGATWIQGIERNPIYTIAHANHLLELRNKERSLRKRSLYLTETPDTVISERMVQDLDWTYGRMLQSAEDFYTMGIPTDAENESVGEYLDSVMEEQLDKYPEHERHLRRLLFHQRVLFECMVAGCNSLSEVSLSEWGCFEELPGVHYTVPPGFEAILDVLKDAIPPENINLSHEVDTISWNRLTDAADDLSKSTNAPTEIRLSCTNGAEFSADIVVVTVSLGVLKHCTPQMFSPPLPATKLASIHQLGFGIVDKVVVEFEDSLVDNDVHRLELLWEDLDAKTTAALDVSETWYRKFFSFDVLHEHYLMGWLSGNAAEHMEKLSDDQIIDAIVKVLTIFLKKDIPRPKRIIRSRWGDNKFTYGAYSYIAVGAHADDIDLLAEPLYGQKSPNKPQVLFAGEATHRTYFSTTHGALLSGQREAQRIIDSYGGC